MAVLVTGCNGCERESPAAPARQVEPSEARAAAQPAAEPATPTPAVPRPPEEDEAAVRRSRKLMGTIFTVLVPTEDTVAGERAAEAALDEVARLEDLLSEWRPDSEISRINAAAGKRAVKVSQETLRVIQAGLAVSRWSDGAFDMTWAALRGLYDFRPGQHRRPTSEALSEQLDRVGYRDVEVNAQRRTVRLRRAGMQIGTGGIAKGYALDRAADLLRGAGFTSFMLFGGGQVQVEGLRKGRPWRVGVQHPRQPDYIGHLELTGGSIATSGDYEHAFIEDGQRWHHILDLKTGLPVRHTASVTVVAESGLYADALSTAIFVLGAKQALARLDDAPGAPAVAVLDADLELHASANMTAKLVMRGL